MSRGVKIAIMAVLIVGFNAAVIWTLLRPPPNFAPQFTLLPEFESRALLNKVAGEYVTGNHEGDRRVVIEAEGTLRFSKFGPQKAVIDENVKTARGGLAEGRAALVTSDPDVITLKDANTVVIYGTTYRRLIR